MTLSALAPYLLVVAGWLIRHYDLLGKLGFNLGGASPAPAAPASAGKTLYAPLTLPAVPNIQLGSHPVLSDAVNAAIKQSVNDALTGHITSIKAEIQNAVGAAVGAAVADLKQKV